MGISKHDKQALADLFIHMGVPLIQAIQTVESWSGESDPEATAPETAKKLSKLLTVTVELATKITKKMEIRDAYTLENVRGKIIRIVTPFISDHYVTNGDVPSQNDLESIASMFDVLLSFADSVSPTDEKGSKPSKMATMVETCEPVLSAIQGNDLGQDSKTLFDEIVAGLVTRSKELGAKLGVSNPIEDGLFKSVTCIFVSDYKNASKQSDLKSIWGACDQKLAIIHGLTKFVGDEAGIKIETPKKEDISPIVPPKKKPAETPKTSDNKKDQEDSDDDGDFNPMAFFGSKD